MKIQLLDGGLANQAFQYIFARYYELSHPGDVMYLDDSYFAITPEAQQEHNGYELEKVFGIRPHMLSTCFDETVWHYMLEERRKGKNIPQILDENQIEIQMISEKVIPGLEELRKFGGPDYAFTGKGCVVPHSQYLPEILELPGNIYYYGYWIQKKWFARYQDIFLKEFSFPPVTDEANLRYQEMILNSNAVSLHVRQGDYKTIDCAWTVQGYRSCVERFLRQAQGKWHVFVFSDDIGWCKEHARQMGLERFHDLTYIEGNTQGTNFRDLQLMSMCRAMIMSNSCFCYLAVLLNTRKQYVLNAVPDRKA